jgi:CheY-like chemotaxis protein
VSKTILVIDDNPIVPALIQKGSRRDFGGPLEIKVETNGMRGYLEACKNRPDLIVLDMIMPESDGRAFLEAYAKGGKLSGVPVIVYSAADEKGLQGLEEQYPMVKRVLHKPLAPSKLLGIIRENLSA